MKYVINKYKIFVTACNCNDFATRCYFDAELYNKTGHGGHCLDCTGFRDGANCERCRENYYLPKGVKLTDSCRPCNCNEIGIINFL